MKNSKKEISFLLLAGGKGSRMNYQDKSTILYDNSQTFLEKILGEIENFSEVIISKNSPIDEKILKNEKLKEKKIQIVKDSYLDCGPLAGIYSGLSASESDYVFVTTCDTPNINREFIQYICQFVSSDWDVIIVKDFQGKLHPLCGIYKKSLKDKVKKHLEDKNFKILNLFQELEVKILDFNHTDFDLEYILNNFNTLEDLKTLKQDKIPKVFAISGIKNSGKTTFITKFIKFLKNRDLKIAVIKHDGHDFCGDIPGTDTYKYLESGADGTLIFSREKFMMLENSEKSSENNPYKDIEKYLNYFKNYDYIILEGFKYSEYPKFEIVRKEISKESCSNPKNLLGILTDQKEIKNSKEILKIDLNSENVFQEILKKIEGEK